jgi:hypothetical protein
MNHQEIYIKSPTPFMLDNWERLLPDWQIPPQTLVVVLLKSQFPLDREGELIEVEKDRLLQHFQKLGQSFYLASQQKGFLTEIVSPKDGTPQYSRRGEAHFDLVAAVHHSLGFNFSRTVQGCKVVKHPVWQGAVYPGLFLSGATVATVESILPAFNLFRNNTLNW